MDGFRRALGRVGFNAPTCQEIIDNGFINISTLSTVTDDELTELVKHIGRWRGAPAPAVVGQPVPLQVTLPYMSVKKLRAMRTWVITQIRKGKVILAAQCTDDAITATMKRSAFVINIHASTDSNPKAPDSLTSFTQWRTWRNRGARSPNSSAAQIEFL